jgi:hypothetical protein
MYEIDLSKLGHMHKSALRTLRNLKNTTKMIPIKFSKLYTLISYTITADHYFSEWQIFA